MLRAAADARFVRRAADSAVKRNLDSLLALIQDYAGRRNEIAHGVVYKYSVHDTSRAGYCLFPSYYNTKKRGLDNLPSYIYSSVEINYFSQRFLTLSPIATDIILTLLDGETLR